MSIEAELLLIACVAAALGVLVGALVVGFGAQRRLSKVTLERAVLEARLKTQEALEREREQALAAARDKLASTFKSLAGESFASHSDTFLKLAQENLGKHHEHAKGELAQRQLAIESLIQPIVEALRKTEQQIAHIEKERHEAFGNITAQLESMSRSQQALQAETRNLVTALRRPEVRGQWGELTLRRVVELAGMVEHCDFTRQVHHEGTDGVVRPDLVVHMPERRELVVDVKTPLDGYLEALEATSSRQREAALTRHARKIRDRVMELSSKAYWSQFEHSPEFVVLFIPGDQFLAAALERDPAIQEDAMAKKVLIATPTHLVGLLKIVAYGWRQLALAENAERIRDLGEELYKRLATFTGHLAKIGRQLGSTVDAYNSAVGSLERQVLPGARKFQEMGIETPKQVESLNPVEKTTRTPETLAVESSTDDG